MRCACDPTRGASCFDCDGRAVEQREIDRLPYAQRLAVLAEHMRLRGVLPISEDRKSVV